MATKDYSLSFPNKQIIVSSDVSNGQYKNLNLNQNLQHSSNAFFESSKIISVGNEKVLNCGKKSGGETVIKLKRQFQRKASTKLPDFENHGDLKAKKDSQTWKKKSTKDLSPFFGFNDDSENEEGLKKSKNTKTNSNTLFLHIFAYENFHEVSSFVGKKRENSKQFIIDPKLVIQNPFEFPRQQNDNVAPAPETAQFKATQQLLNPNSLLNELQNFGNSLKGSTDEKRRTKIDDYREKLIGNIQNLIQDSVKLVLNNSPVSFFSNLFGNVVSQVFDLNTYFEWLHFVEDGEKNAEFVDREFSNSSVYDAMEKAAEVFIQTKDGNICQKEKNFSIAFLSDDANQLAENVIGFCNILESPLNAQLTINSNDVRVIFGQIIEKFLNNRNTTEMIQERITKPIVFKNGVAWVQYEFLSQTSTHELINSNDHRVNFSVKVRYFVFKNEGDFQNALKNAEERRA
uniref:Non-structural maintenance of chromosomes element 4 n=1 Tax=Panagrolaimus davidi TaxID=227884 RepID=A0A914QBK0_9BILA